MSPPVVFVSYDYDNDRKYKNLLRAWDANGNIEFAMYDHSVDVSVRSTEAAPIKRVISRRLRESDVLVVLIGEKTYQSGWVAWEIDKALDLELPIVGLKIRRSNPTPPILYGQGVSWAYGFTLPKLRDALYGLGF